MSRSQPRTTPMARAAASPVGANPVTRLSIMTNLFVIVVGPLLVPALLLMAVRRTAVPSLSDVAFAFVAVAFAGITRAIVVKSEAWMFYTFVASLVIALQAGIGAVVDNDTESGALAKAVDGTAPGDAHSTLPALRGLAADVLEKDPVPIQWTIVVVIGVIFVAGTVEMVRRER